MLCQFISHHCIEVVLNNYNYIISPVVYKEPLKCVMTDADSEENDSIPFEIPAKRLHLQRMHMKNWVVSLDSTKYKVLKFCACMTL